MRRTLIALLGCAMAAGAAGYVSAQQEPTELNLHCNFGILDRNYHIDLKTGAVTNLDNGEHYHAEITYQWIKIYKPGNPPPIEVINRVTGVCHTEWQGRHDPDQSHVFSGHCTSNRQF